MPRVLLLALPVLLPMLPAQAQQPPVYAGIDHVALGVAELPRALAFHARLFGAGLWQRQGDAHRYLRLGSGWLALTRQTPVRAQHAALGVEAFDPGSAGRWLDLQKLRWLAVPEPGLQLDDADGNRILLLSQDNPARLLQPVAQPEAPAPAPTVFQPLAIDELFVTVANLEVDGLFYARLLGQTGTLQAGSLWFSLGGGARLRLGQAPAGQLPGLHHVAVRVADTDLEAAAEAVFAAGGIIETILPAGFSFWDPDGHRIVVHTTGAP